MEVEMLYCVKKRSIHTEAFEAAKELSELFAGVHETRTAPSTPATDTSRANKPILSWQWFRSMTSRAPTRN